MEHTHEGLVQMIFLGKIYGFSGSPAVHFPGWSLRSRALDDRWRIQLEPDTPHCAREATETHPKDPTATRNIHRNAPSFQPWCSILHHVQHHHRARWFSLLSLYPGHSIAVGNDRFGPISVVMQAFWDTFWRVNWGKYCVCMGQNLKPTPNPTRIPTHLLKHLGRSHTQDNCHGRKQSFEDVSPII